MRVPLAEMMPFRDRSFGSLATLVLVTCCAGCLLDWDRSWTADTRAADDISKTDRGRDLPKPKLDGPTSSLDWAVAVGATESGNAHAVALDASENVYVAGSFWQQVNNPQNTLKTSGQSDLLLTKLSSRGAFNWIVHSGGLDKDRAVSLEVAPSGEQYITGYFSKQMPIYTTLLESQGSTDVVVIKISAKGLHWAVKMGGSGSDSGNAVALDRSGTRLWIAGRFRNTVTFGPTTLTARGADDIFVAQLSATTGAVLKAIRAGGEKSDVATSVVVDGTGAAYVAGYFEGNASFGSMDRQSSGSGDKELFVAKVTPDGGRFEWVSAGGSKSADEATGLTMDSAGKLYITGYHTGAANFGGKPAANTKGGSDLFVAKLERDGRFLWVTSSDGSAARGNGVVAYAGSTVVVTGFHMGSTTLGDHGVTTAGGRDILVAALSSDGKVLWATSGGGPHDDEGTALTLDREGRPVVTGHFEIRATLGNHQLQAPKRDIYVWKLPRPVLGPR